MIKVLIADDQELIRESLTIILDGKEDVKVVGAAQNGQEVINMVKELKPDVVLMDVRMPKIDGVQCTRLIKETEPEIKIIILTTFDDDQYIADAFMYGAEGYLLKGDPVSNIIMTIKTVYDGGVMMNSTISKKLIKIYSFLAKSNLFKKVDDDVINTLTKTEWKIIEEVEKGANSKEIANNLYLSYGTVRNYLSAILNKLELRDRTQLAIWALDHKKREDNEKENNLSNID